MKKRLLVLSLLLLLSLVSTVTLVGCTETEPGHQIIYGSVDGTYAAVQLDEQTAGVVVLQNISHEIHDGNCFYSYDVTDIPNSANRTILINTNPVAGTSTHFYWTVDFELEARIEIFEAGSYSNAGTAMPVYNRNRNYADNALTAMYHTPTIDVLGTLILEQQLSSGNKAGGTESALDKLVLRTDTAYFLRITNMTVNDNTVSGEMIWYEQ